LKIVEKFGHECVEAKNGEKAWDLLQSMPEVDVIISDWMMPGIDGPEFCHRVRKKNASSYTFFILWRLAISSHRGLSSSRIRIKGSSLGKATRAVSSGTS
jgi:CheY-like chemotaxis protein